MLNNKDATPTSNCHPTRLLNSNFWYKFTYQMTNSADPDSRLPTDLDLHCLQRQGISGFSRTRVNNVKRNMKYQIIIINSLLTCPKYEIVHLTTWCESKMLWQNGNNCRFWSNCSIFSSLICQSILYAKLRIFRVNVEFWNHFSSFSEKIELDNISLE